MSMPATADEPEEVLGEEQLEFLDHVWGSEPRFVQLVQRRRDSEGKRTGQPTDDKAFRWPDERTRIGRYIDARLEEELYFAVPGYKKPVRQKEHVEMLNVVYVDDDGVTNPFKLESSFAVESSPGHMHRYWILDKAYNAHDVSMVGREISQHHKHDSEFHNDLLEADQKRGEKPHKFCGTDPGGWDLSQILRMPGTLNTKPEYGPDFKHRVTVLEETGKVYTLAELQEAYPKTQPDLIEALPLEQISALPADMPDHVALLTQLGSRSDLISLIMDEPTGRGNSQGWDERLFALENELFRIGFTTKEVYAIAWHSACNKFKRGIRNADNTFSPRPNPELDLWRDVNKAAQVHQNHQNEWTSPGYDTSSEVDVQVNGVEARIFDSVKPTFELDLLTQAEHERISGLITFIDEYVEWATSKTDAAQVYHVASAFTILSVVFGEFGHAFPRFGKLRLNMWFLVMGKTTRARKSTSRSLMMKIIDGVQTDNYKYDEGSDFTGEGLANALLEKPRQSSLIHRDEVQGMFKEISTKSYMAGLSDMLTELYDGVVRGKKRATGGVTNSDKVETNFVLFLMGIVSKITSVLTLEDFQSGFLARFIHVIGEAPPRTKETEWLDQASPSEIASGDPAYLKIVSNLMRVRAKWQKISPTRHTVAIIFEDDAWRRWNEANWDLQEAIKLHERAEILEAAVDRMGKSAMKAATLLAMSEGRERVNMDDVLVALDYTSRWASDMVRSTEMVSESFWQKDMNMLQDLAIKRGGVIKWEEAYSKMGKQPNEFKNLVEGLAMSGRVLIQTDQKTKTRWIEVQ